MATNAEISGSAAGKLMCHEIEFGENAAKFSRRRAKARSPRLASRLCIHIPTSCQPPRYKLAMSRFNCPRAIGGFCSAMRIVSCVNIAGAQGYRLVSQSRNRADGSGGKSLDPLAATAANRGAMRQEKTEYRCQARRPTSASRSSPQLIPQPMLASRNAAAASLDPPPRPGAHGNSFHKFDASTQRAATSFLEQFERLDHEIVRPSRNFLIGRRRSNWPARTNIKLDMAKRAVSGCLDARNVT